jgi:hypothetical protein
MSVTRACIADKTNQICQLKVGSLLIALFSGQRDFCLALKSRHLCLPNIILVSVSVGSFQLQRGKDF